MSDGERRKIVGVGRMNEHAVMVEYSDNTSAIYTADQLATLARKMLAEWRSEEGVVDVHGEKFCNFHNKCRVARQTAL